MATTKANANQPLRRAMRPTNRRHWLATVGITATTMALAGCNLFTPKAYRLQPGIWRGRISIQLESETRPQSYIAGFTLEGNYQLGTLEVFNPIGSTIARLEWNGQIAQLNDGSQIIEDTSLDQLLAQVFATPLPTEALFAWLAGDPLQAQGWEVNLDRYQEGRIEANRFSPLPIARLRIALFSD